MKNRNAPSNLEENLVYVKVNVRRALGADRLTRSVTASLIAKTANMTETGQQQLGARRGGGASRIAQVDIIRYYR